MNKIKLMSLFSGYGGAEFALKKVNIDFECVGFSEIDKFAVQCYEQNHCEMIGDCFNAEELQPKNYGDCTKINPNELPDFDLLTGGFPCTDVSIAGKQDLSKGRTTLFNEIIRIAEIKQPKFMLLENVKGLLSKKFIDFFGHTLRELDRIGYNVVKVYDRKKKRNLIPIFNSKEHGIPQNRQRVFYICSRKDVDFNFKFPEKVELKIFVKDILEDKVDDKYILSEKAIKLIKDRINTSYKSKFNPEITNTLRTNYGNSFANETYIVENVNPSRKGMNGNVYSGNISPTLTTNKGEGIKIL